MSIDREEVSLVAELAMLKIDLKYTHALGELHDDFATALGDLRADIATLPELINERIKACQVAQDTKRRWTFGTIISICSVFTAIGALLIAIWR